jgi:hypothetical protein
MVLLGFIIAGVVLIGLGIAWLFIRRSKTPETYYKQTGKKAAPLQSKGGQFRHTDSSASTVCPVCSANLPASEKVHSSVFPPEGDGTRIMHIQGCVYCLAGERKRVCPVCGHTLSIREPLVARVFERPGRTHVHVLGCTRCRGARPK